MSGNPEKGLTVEWPITHSLFLLLCVPACCYASQTVFNDALVPVSLSIIPFVKITEDNHVRFNI